MAIIKERIKLTPGSSVSATLISDVVDTACAGFEKAEEAFEKSETAIVKAQNLEVLLNNKEPLIVKNTAYNKNFGAGAPLADGTASAGSSNTVARFDHRHPRDTGLIKNDETIGSVRYLERKDINMTIGSGLETYYITNCSGELKITGAPGGIYVDNCPGLTISGNIIGGKISLNNCKGGLTLERSAATLSISNSPGFILSGTVLGGPLNLADCVGTLTISDRAAPRIYASNSSKLNIGGKTSGNWQYIWFDGVASSVGMSLGQKRVIMRYADGTQIIHGECSGYGEDASNTVSVTLPVSFADVDYSVFLTHCLGSDFDSYRSLPALSQTQTVGGFSIRYVYLGKNYRNKCKYIAIGRWDKQV